MAGLALCWVLFLGVFASAHAIGHGLSGGGDPQSCSICPLLLDPAPNPEPPRFTVAPLVAAPHFAAPALPVGALRPAPIALRSGRAPPTLSRA